VRYVRLVPWLVVVACAFIALGVIVSGRANRPEFVHGWGALSEGIYFLLVLVWLTIVAQLHLKARSAIPLLAGFSLLAIGALGDALGELFQPVVPAWQMMEYVGLPVGALAVAIGLYYWGREYEWGLLRIRQEKDVYPRGQRDELTRLYNRAHFDAMLPGLLPAARFSGHPLALLIAEIDDFKQFNQSLGEGAGDRMLQAVANAVRLATRKADLAFRIGTEQFAVILPDAKPDSATEIGERIRNAFEALPLQVMAGAQTRPTISLGIAFLRPGDNGAILTSRAQQAMQRAKRNGKNRIETDESA
jgi:diguanylate cyclase (GGDEF)-like protein